MGRVGQDHQTVRTLVNDIQEQAQARAEMAVDKSEHFRAPGGGIIAKPDTKFTGAMELGSKEAYSTIVRSRLRETTEGDAKRTANNTGMIAEASQRSAVLLTKIADSARAGTPLLPHMPAAF